MAEEVIITLPFVGLQMPEEKYRELLRCEKCGHDNYANPEGERLCVVGLCVEFYCKGCGYSNSGWGPMGCRCEKIYAQRASTARKINTMLRRRDRRKNRRDRLNARSDRVHRVSSSMSS